MLSLTKPVFKIDANGHAYGLLNTKCGAAGLPEADREYSNHIPCKACREAERAR